MIPKKTAKLVVKDANGNLVQILPEIYVDGELAADGTEPVANRAVAAAVNELSSKASVKPEVKIVEEEPTSQNAASLPSKSLIAWLQPEIESWSITIDTEGVGTGERTGEIPFCLLGAGDVSILVDWGDGTVEKHMSADALSMTCIKHEYETAGVYSIRMESSGFSQLYLWTYSARAETYAATLKTVDSPLPAVAGVRTWYYEEGMSGDGYIGNVDNMMYGCFDGCGILQSIPSGVFDANPASTSFEKCFNNCHSLMTIPSGIFDRHTAATSFNSCFYCSALQSIPSGLFDHNAAAVDFAYCFERCESLSSIPSGLFRNNAAAKTFYGCFDSCDSLVAVPSGLFSGCPAAESFIECFAFCGSLVSISANAFAGCTEAKYFHDCFYNCDALETIPSSLFNACTKAVSFEECFAACYSLVSIPENLFANNTAALSFDECFGSCSSLASVPENLFANNTAATDFDYCFRWCSALEDFAIRIGSPNVTNASTFATKKAGTTRTVYVPSGSTTYNTFDVNASYLGLTVVQE